MCRYHPQLGKSRERGLNWTSESRHWSAGIKTVLRAVRQYAQKSCGPLLLLLLSPPRKLPYTGVCLCVCLSVCFIANSRNNYILIGSTWTRHQRCIFGPGWYHHIFEFIRIWFVTIRKQKKNPPLRCNAHCLMFTLENGHTPLLVAVWSYLQLMTSMSVSQ